MREKIEKLFSYNPTHFSFVISLLIATGILIIFTASSITANDKFGGMLFFAKKQFFVSILGMLIYSSIQRIDLKFIEKLTLPLIFLSIILAIGPLVPGIQHKVNGASRWIKFGPLTFQPAELCKLSLILFLAKNLSRPSMNMLNLKSGIASNMSLFLIYAVLLMLQPDFGSTVLLASVTFLMMFVAGLNRNYIIAACITGMFAVIAAIIHAPYRLARLTSFLDPWKAVKEGGFQIIQSYIAFYNGNIFGTGLGNSKQKLFFLPEAHTDFILSVVGEELGLVGVSFVILCYLYLIKSGFDIAKNTSDCYKKYLAFGITTLISVQTSINMGVAMGLFPTKGMPLPFVSYGSSSLIVFIIAASILNKIGRDELYKVKKS